MKALVVAVSAFVFGACAARHVRQPHMHRAIESLQAARAELENATADKGGHRVAAIGFINAALEQVREGIRFDDTH